MFAGLDAGISIHTPLAGSDPFGSGVARYDGISIHTPLAGGDFRWCG